MLLFFIHFRSDTRVLPGSRRGAEIAALLRAHTAELTSHTDFLMVTFLRFQKPGVAVHSPATQVGNGVFFWQCHDGNWSAGVQAAGIFLWEEKHHIPR